MNLRKTLASRWEGRRTAGTRRGKLTIVTALLGTAILAGGMAPSIAADDISDDPVVQEELDPIGVVAGHRLAHRGNREPDPDGGVLSPSQVAVASAGRTA